MSNMKSKTDRNESIQRLQDLVVIAQSEGDTKRVNMIKVMIRAIENKLMRLK